MTNTPGSIDLAGHDILVDTYNLRLKKGSGIKTYGVTLIEALNHLKAPVSLLGDRPVGRSRHKALEEVLFFDAPLKKGKFRTILSSASKSARRLLKTTSPMEISRNFVIPDDATRKLSNIQHYYNIGGVYDAANVTYQNVGRFTRIKTPKHIKLWHATTLLPIQVKRAKTVTTIHDVIPLRLPYTTLDNKKIFYNLLHDTLKRSDLIFTVSQCTKRDILLFFNDFPEEKIVVTYQSVPFKLYQRNEKLERATLDRHGITRSEYLLFVGNIEPKKNIKSLLKAVSAMDLDIPLVIVGRKAWLWKDQMEPLKGLSKSEKDSKFKFLDYVSESDLHALYAGATCLVFPSLYEGFGLPPLEAMAHGCPVIVSDISSLPEVCAEAALYVDPYDPDSIMEQIDAMLSDSRRREQLIQGGYKRLEYFSTVQYAKRLAKAYGRILD